MPGVLDSSYEMEGQLPALPIARILSVTLSKISVRKVNELEFQCYQNALRLHFDSILLLRADSYPSAFALSVIACEEFGKGFALAEVSFQAGFRKVFNNKDRKLLRTVNVRGKHG